MRSLKPLDIETIRASLSKTHKVLTLTLILALALTLVLTLTRGAQA